MPSVELNLSLMGLWPGILSADLPEELYLITFEDLLGFGSFRFYNSNKIFVEFLRLHM